MMDHITLVIPTRNREAKLQRTLATLPLHRKWLRVHVVCDGDSQTYNHLRSRQDIDVTLVPDHKGAVYCRNLATAQAPDGVVCATDDVLFKPGAIGKARDLFRQKFPDDDGVLGFRQSGNHHPTGVALVGRKFLERYPEKQLFCPEYMHFAAQEIQWLADRVGRFESTPFVVLDHLHPSKHRKEVDKTHIQSRRHKNADRSLRQKRNQAGLVWGSDNGWTRPTPTVTFAVHIFLDLDRPELILSPEWVKNRIALFHEFTLKSLLNQSFQGFRVMVLCGNRNDYITSEYPWHKRVSVHYGMGQEFYESEVDTDYVVAFRLDSDDLLHRDAMAEIRDVSLGVIQEGVGDGRCLIFRKNLCWDRVNRTLAPHDRQAPPFFTHIYGRKQYKNWETWRTRFFIPHGRAGGRWGGTRELSERKVCVVRHNNNISLLRRGLTAPVLNKNDRAALRAANDTVILDEAVIAKQLEPFGVDETWTPTQ